MEPHDRTQGVAGRWLASSEWLAVGGDAGWATRNRWMSTLRARLGRVDGLSLVSRLEGRGVEDPATLRWLLDEGWSPWLRGWYSRPGWTTSYDVHAAVSHQLAANAGLVYDIPQRDWLAKYLAAAYRHPCGCIATTLRMNWRAGRNGIDVSLMVDLMP